MNNHLKVAYNLGSQKALQDLGITKRSDASDDLAEQRAGNIAAAERADISPWRPRLRHLGMTSLAIPGTVLGGTAGGMLGGGLGYGLGEALGLDRDKASILGVLGLLTGAGLGGYGGMRAGANLDKRVASKLHELSDRADSKFI